MNQPITRGILDTEAPDEMGYTIELNAQGLNEEEMEKLRAVAFSPESGSKIVSDMLRRREQALKRCICFLKYIFCRRIVIFGAQGQLDMEKSESKFKFTAVPKVDS